MSEHPNRLLPDLSDAHTARFFEAARSHRLEVQRCEDCGYLRWPPGPVCPACLSRNAAWVELSGSGTIWSVAIYHRSFHRLFDDLVPYALAIVQLDEGPRLMSNLRGRDPLGAVIGQRVRVCYEPVTSSVTLPMFTPLDDDPTDDGRRASMPRAGALGAELVVRR